MPVPICVLQIYVHNDVTVLNVWAFPLSFQFAQKYATVRYLFIAK